ncbi:MAG TPA: DUF167 family protein [Candidatus Limnocylindrales bacterium]|nr:DUF167 family protein [Candidatus Limnocylindrales bacterium]
MAACRRRADGVRLAVRLIPGAGRDSVDGVADGVLRARVAARPVDGAANEALRRLLAAALGVAPGRLAIVSGQASRTKVVRIRGLPADALRSRWPGIEV